MTLSSISTPLTENYDVLRDYLDSHEKIRWTLSMLLGSRSHHPSI